MLLEMNIAGAVDGLRSGGLSAAAFRRFLVTADNWVATRHGDVLSLRSNTEKGTSGVDAFGMIDDGLRIATIDAGTTHETEIAREEFAAWREIVAAVSVERSWQRLVEGTERPDDLAHVARFAAYHIAAVKAPEGYLLIHVPHDDGGMFAPVFTHRDALDLALEDFRRNFPPESIVCTETAGPRLFPPLAKEKADGIVINYLGPSKPVAFGMGVIALILEELDKQA
jgi:hypothetical protein